MNEIKKQIIKNWIDLGLHTIAWILVLVVFVWCALGMIDGGLT